MESSLPDAEFGLVVIGWLGPVVTLLLIETIGFGLRYVVCALLPLVAAAVLVGGIRREIGQSVPAVGS